MTAFMTDQGLRDWLNGLASSRTLIAPRTEKGRTLFRPVGGADEIDFDYTQSVVPPKEWFFPRTEALFTFDADGRAIELPVVRGPRVIFGIRPCDARALALLDRPFGMEPADSLWETRRKETALIGLACDRQQLPECFCASVRGGPRDSAHVDVLAVKTAGGYALEAASERGEALLRGAGGEFDGVLPPPPDVVGDVPAGGADRRILALFDSPYWERLADRCLGCRMCSFLCPTCHCFDVRDYEVDGRLERDRCWDGCQSKHFTKLAGGHNPRGTKGARLRQFYAHKYLYFPERFFPEKAGAVRASGRGGEPESVAGDGAREAACVGCGRCAHYCPANIDIRETLRDLQRLEV